MKKRWKVFMIKWLIKIANLVYFDLCDNNHFSGIAKSELYDILKRNIISEEDKIKLKKSKTRENTKYCFYKI